MIIYPIAVLKDNYVWTLISEKKRLAIIVDPGSAREVLDFLGETQLNLLAILVTHHHWDHTNGIDEILSHYPNIRVYGHNQQQIPSINYLVNEHDSIVFHEFDDDTDRDVEFKVLEIPGHTLSHIAYYGNGVLFCGDTLFSAGCGRLFEGTPEQMVASLQKLRNLPDDTLVYCAHEYTANNLRFAETVEPDNQAIIQYKAEVSKRLANKKVSLPSTIAIEKAINPFLRLNEASVRERVSNARAGEGDGDGEGKKLANDVEVFAKLRRWKDVF